MLLKVHAGHFLVAAALQRHLFVFILAHQREIIWTIFFSLYHLYPPQTQALKPFSPPAQDCNFVIFVISERPLLRSDLVANFLIGKTATYQSAEEFLRRCDPSVTGSLRDFSSIDPSTLSLFCSCYGLPLITFLSNPSGQQK